MLHLPTEDKDIRDKNTELQEDFNWRWNAKIDKDVYTK